MNKIIEIASSQVGYTENPGNDTIYGEWFGFNHVPWCGMFVSWCYAQAGTPLPNIGFSKGFAGCQTAVKFFKEHNMITDTPQPGDIVFFDWNGDGRYDHTGLFVQKKDDIHFETIEGNTSTTNQSNGGQVMKRLRMFNKSVLFAHPQTM